MDYKAHNLRISKRANSLAVAPLPPLLLLLLPLHAVVVVQQ